MIRKLRRRFILITMLSVSLVLLIIMGTINYLNYRNVVKDADTVLAMLREFDGSFPWLDTGDGPDGAGFGPADSGFGMPAPPEGGENPAEIPVEGLDVGALEDGADAAAVEKEIKEMPNYFSDYDTTVHFISEEELQENHSGMAHGGFVFRTGKTGVNGEHKHIIEYSLKLDSNPEFTTSVLVAYARAAFRLHSEGQTGCKTVLDIPPAYLSAQSGEELRAHLL